MAKNISITIKKRNNIKIFSPRDLIISTEQRKKRKAKYARYKIFRLAQNLITTQYERKGEGEKRKKKERRNILKNLLESRERKGGTNNRDPKFTVERIPSIDSRIVEFTASC